ncbi:hypothetical protein QYF61_020975, partial [Mycteria americana]
MWHFGTWFIRHGGVGLTVGLDDLRGSAWRREGLGTPYCSLLILKRKLIKNMEKDFLPGPVVTGQEIGYKEEILYDEGGETLEQVAQGSCGCLILGSVQGQVGWGLEQLDL